MLGGKLITINGDGAAARAAEDSKLKVVKQRAKRWRITAKQAFIAQPFRFRYRHVPIMFRPATESTLERCSQSCTIIGSPRDQPVQCTLNPVQ